jgi:hypothetical protein
VSVTGKLHVPLVFHMTVALVAVPDSSTNACPVVFVNPFALFQFGFATTPATSVLPMAVPCPTKSTLITPFPAAATVSVTVVVCVTLPLTPFSVNVDVPSGVLPVVVTVNVAVPAPVTVPGEKLAVAPAGNPLALSVTTPANPFNEPTLAVYVVALPTITVCVPGLADIVKSGGGGCVFTTKLTVVVCVKLPLVPVIVNVDVPTGVLPVVVTVNVAVPAPVTVPGEKLAVAPVGNPLALSVTTPVNPFNAPMLAVYVVALPTLTVCVLGLADIVKSCVAVARGTT